MIRTTAALALAALLTAPAAQAALECQYYDEAVLQAVKIMQIADTTILPPAIGDHRCTIRGTVVRNFRGPHPEGTLIETYQTCVGYPLAPGQEEEIVIGADWHWDFDRLRNAAVIELHIQEGGGPAGAGAGIVLLDAPTDAPMWESTCN